MWLVSCRRQRMLTQGPAPDPKCELNITSFLTLPHPLHCPICVRDVMIIVLLLQVTGGLEWLWGWFTYVRVCVGGQWVGIRFVSIFCSVFVLLLIVLSWLVHDSLLHLCHCSFFAFFISGPFN